MESIRELYRIGKGPSSSHTLGSSTAAKIFKERNPNALQYRVTLYGSLAATGKGHLTEQAIKEILPSQNTTIIFKKEKILPQHPNGMLFEAEKKRGKKVKWLVFSIGGGAIRDLKSLNKYKKIYPHKSFEEINGYCSKKGIALYEYLFKCEDKEGIFNLYQVLQ